MTKEQTANYRTALKDAREDFRSAMARLHEVENEVVQLNDQIRNLRRTITALAALCSENPGVDKLGITDACIEAMNIVPETVSTADVVGWLEYFGFDFSMHKNADASVHAVLSRLAKDGKIMRVDTEKGVRWRGPKYNPKTDPTVITDDDVPF